MGKSYDSDRMIIAALHKLLGGKPVTVTPDDCEAAGDKAIIVVHGDTEETMKVDVAPRDWAEEHMEYWVSPPQ